MQTHWTGIILHTVSIHNKKAGSKRTSHLSYKIEKLERHLEENIIFEAFFLQSPVAFQVCMISATFFLIPTENMLNKHTRTWEAPRKGVLVSISAPSSWQNPNGENEKLLTFSHWITLHPEPRIKALDASLIVPWAGFFTNILNNYSNPNNGWWIFISAILQSWNNFFN